MHLCKTLSSPPHPFLCTPFFAPVRPSLYFGEQYECGSPGAPEAHHEGLSGCSWSYDHTVPTYSEDMSQYLRLVKPADYDAVSRFVAASQKPLWIGSSC